MRTSIPDIIIDLNTFLNDGRTIQPINKDNEGYLLEFKGNPYSELGWNQPGTETEGIYLHIAPNDETWEELQQHLFNYQMPLFTKLRDILKTYYPNGDSFSYEAHVDDQIESINLIIKPLI